MAKRKTVKLTRKDKRFLAYAEKLRHLRQYVKGFDSSAWENIYLYQPPPDMAPDLREQAQKERFRKIMQVSNKYSALKPFLVGTKKRVAPKSPERIEALRQYAQLPNIKGLRAVPVEASDPSKLRVKFSTAKVTQPAAKGHKKPRVKNVVRVRISEGHFRQEYYPFPTSAKALSKLHGPENLAHNLNVMIRGMMRTLPPGQYVFRHASYLLLEPKGDRDTFARRAAQFFETDSGEKYFVIANLLGVVRLADTADEMLAVTKQIREARTRSQHEKAVQRRRARERNLRKFIKRKRHT